MRLKTSRIAVFATTLVAVGMMTVATTSASASVTPPTEATCSETSSPSGLLIGPIELAKPVSGIITVKKLGQKIALKNGVFAGTIALCVREPGILIEGTITQGSIKIPPFTASVNFKAPPSMQELGLSIVQFGPGEGTITRPAGPPTKEEEENGVNVNLNVQAEANIGFSNVTVLNKRKPVSCQTKEPIKLPLVKHLSLLELIFGTTITGTATLPEIVCSGGPTGTATGITLTREMSGPENAFSITFQAPSELETSLSGGGQSGGAITVKEGAAVTDTATLRGTKAATATGTVTYKVYSDNQCNIEVARAGTVGVNGELVPASEAKTLSAGTYYWQASYSGDEVNGGSKSECGSEVETVTK